MASIEEEDIEKQERKEWIREHNRQVKLDSRLSMPFIFRFPLATSISFLTGAALGVSHGSKMTALRFRAENAHRLPTTPAGWYLYHKSKNYNTALGGVKEGFKMGIKVSVWTAAAFSIEEFFDQYRGTKDFVNTMLASLSVAGAFSLWSMSSLMFTPTSHISTPTDSCTCRPIPRTYRSENGEDCIGHWSRVWTGTRRCGSGKRKKTRICGFHFAERTKESRRDRTPNGIMIHDLHLHGTVHDTSDHLIGMASHSR